MDMVSRFLSLMVITLVLGCSRQTETPAPPAAAAPIAQFPALLENALTRAKAEGKMVFLDFTGSDWCPPCIELERTIFSSSRFKDFADANLIMLKLDFPQRRELPPEEKKTNETLGDMFKVDGYPTLILLHPDRNVLWRMTGKPDSVGSLLAILEEAKERSGGRKPAG